MKRYEIEKETFKAYVKNGQDQCKRADPSFHELSGAGDHFHKKGKRLGLTKGLEAQGIPKPVRVEILEKVDTNHHKCDII